MRIIRISIEGAAGATQGWAAISDDHYALKRRNCE